MGSLKKEVGFTLIELLVVIAIIGILVAIAIPTFSTYRDSAKIGRMASNLRTFGDGFKIYLLDNNCYPPDSHNDAPNNLKNGYGTEDYLPIQAWTSTPDWGGFYNWEGPDNYSYAGISFFGTTAPEPIMIKLDKVIDNGDLNSGVFRKTSNGRYTYIVDDNPEGACS